MPAATNAFCFSGSASRLNKVDFPTLGLENSNKMFLQKELFSEDHKIKVYLPTNATTALLAYRIGVSRESSTIDEECWKIDQKVSNLSV